MKDARSIIDQVYGVYRSIENGEHKATDWVRIPTKTGFGFNTTRFIEVVQSQLGINVKAETVGRYLRTFKASKY